LINDGVWILKGDPDKQNPWTRDGEALGKESPGCFNKPTSTTVFEGNQEKKDLVGVTARKGDQVTKARLGLTPRFKKV